MHVCCNVDLFSLVRVSLADYILINIYQEVTYPKLCLVWLGVLVNERKVARRYEFFFGHTHIVPIYDKSLKKNSIIVVEKS